MSKPLVCIDTLSIGYQTRRSGFVHILKDLSLEVPEQGVFGLIGESGSGKSTLALALFGYLNQECQLLNGQILIDDVDPFALNAGRLAELRRHRIALVPQFKGQALNPSTPIGKQLQEKLAWSSDLDRAAAKDQIIALLDYVQLPAPHILYNRYPHQLSEGQHQRAVIAMALLGEPDLIVLDEPTGGLDVTTQAHILDTLKVISEESNIAMLLISHDLGVIARLSQRVGVMYAGAIVEEAAVETIFDRPAHPYTRGLLRSAPRLKEPGRRYTIPGKAALAGVLPGCAFAPRCPLATQLCQETMPPVEALREKSHWVRCHHWHRVDAGPQIALPPRQESPPPATEPLIELREISINYHEASFLDRFRRTITAPTVVERLNLNIASGETVALIGESGSGKSTIAKTIAGLHQAFAGEIIFADKELRQSRRTLALRQKIQIIFQDPGQALNPRFTIAQILEQPLRRYFPELSQAQRNERIFSILEYVRLEADFLDRYPRELSNGEIQRVAIARAFIAEPELVLCDEVTAALDSSVQAAVLDLLSRLQRETNCAFLFISHDLAIVRAIADRVAALYLGRLCQLGKSESFFQAPLHPYCEALLGAVLEPETGKIPRLFDQGAAELEAPTKGCPYQNRCQHHQGDICDQEAPPWQTGSDQAIRCHIPLEQLKLLQPALGGIE